jgi:hypothetical protein
MSYKLRLEDYSEAYERVQAKWNLTRKSLRNTTDPDARGALEKKLENLDLQLSLLKDSLSQHHLLPPTPGDGDSIVDSGDIREDMRRRIDAMMNVGETR